MFYKFYERVCLKFTRAYERCQREGDRVIPKPWKAEMSLGCCFRPPLGGLVGGYHRQPPAPDIPSVPPQYPPISSLCPPWHPWYHNPVPHLISHHFQGAPLVWPGPNTPSLLLSIRDMRTLHELEHHCIWWGGMFAPLHWRKWGCETPDEPNSSALDPHRHQSIYPFITFHHYLLHVIIILF